jgi:transcriptional regulator with XRE-family HTH domain
MYTSGMTLKELRKQKGYTETSIGKAAGLSRFGVRRVEQGEATTTATLEKIADVLNTEFSVVAELWHESKKSLSKVNKTIA